MTLDPEGRIKKRGDCSWAARTFFALSAYSIMTETS